MFFKDLKPKPGAVIETILVNVHLPVKLGHKDANKLFAEPLKAQLAAASLGTVLDCRLRKRASGSVRGVDLYIGLRDATQDALLTIARMLEALSAPCGSSIRMADGIADPLVFGTTEGLEMSIASHLAPGPDERRDLAKTCHDAIGSMGVSRGWDQFDDRTKFYFYGEDFSEMKERIGKRLQGHPRYGDALLRRMA